VRKILRFRYIAPLLIACLWYCAIIIAADEVKDRSVYIISSGDQLLITVVGHEKELTALAVVRPDGMIAYPLVGDVQAAGLTVSQLSRAICEKLSTLGYYRESQVTVQLKEIRQEIVYISGDVNNPGEKRFPKPANIIEVLAAAGWFKETADLANVRILKQQNEVISVDLSIPLEEDFMQNGVVSEELRSEELMLGNGDVIVIPSKVKANRISVIGYVSNPGQYWIKSPINLLEVLILAGGFIDGVADLRHVKIVRADGSIEIADATKAWTESATDPTLLDTVEPGDSVIVPKRGKINILGFVKNQGAFPVDGEISIVEALSLAGIDREANLKKLKIIRSSGERVTVDYSEIWDPQECELEETLSQGDTLIVSKARHIDWGAVSSVVLIVSTIYAMFR